MLPIDLYHELKILASENRILFSTKNIKMLRLLSKVHSLNCSELISMSVSTKNEILLNVASIEPKDGIMAEKACLLISKILTTSKSQEIEYIVIKNVILWLKKILLLYRYLVKITLYIVKTLIKSQFTADILENLFGPIKSLLHLYVEYLLNESTPDSKEDMKTVIQILNLLLNDDLIYSISKNQCANINILETVADIIFQINFSENIQSQISNCLFIPLYTVPILSKISVKCSEYTELHSGNFFGLIKAYMHFDLEGRMCPRKLLISHQSIYNSLEETKDLKRQQSNGGKVTRTTKPRFLLKGSQSVQIFDSLQQNSTFATTEKQLPNFLDYLDIGDESESEHDRSIQCMKVRLAALALFKLLTKSLKNHIFYDYWHAFFPSNASCKEGILYVATSDSSVQCRNIALEIASQIIFGAKAFIEQAEVPKKSPTSYMPLCFSLGQILQVIYSILIQALATESSLTVLSNILNCLAVLVQYTAFHRMHCDIVGGLLLHIRKLLNHEDAVIQFHAFKVIEFLLSTPNITKEISDLLGIPLLYNLHPNQSYSSDSLDLDSLQVEWSEEYQGNCCGEKQKPALTKKMQCDTWILKIVLQKLNQRNPELPAPTRIKILQVISSMSIHFSMLIHNLEEIAISLKISLLDISTEVNLCASRCLDNIAYNMSKFLLHNKSNEPLSCQYFWIHMLPLATEKITDKHKSTAVKISLIDFLSNIGVIVYNRLSNLFQINLLSFLCGVGSDTDEDTAVRAAAVRALAVYVLFPSIKQDLVFVENAAELAILLVSDQNLLVRIKSLWSIGNISDALVSNCELVRDERISKKLLTRLISVSLNACNDNDKVRCNSVRALGNFMRLVSTEMVEDLSCRRLFEDVTQKLVFCVNASGNAKVKWNSCYAIGCVMKNYAFLKGASQHDNFKWIEKMLTTLCSVIVQHYNYKVRINATNAITHISERSFYAQYFKLCWCSLMKALEESYVLINFLEYNHRDYLQERLCIALGHFINLASKDDFHEMGKEIEKRVELIKEIWFKVLNRMSPECAAPLLTCPVSLKKRIKLESSLTEEQSNTIHLLTYIFGS